jgi:dTMP kinase
VTQGLFITLEGIEGVGKSTHAGFIADLLTRNGRTVRFTREPGGTMTGESVREILLHGHEAKINSITELLLIFSARAQHLDEIIKPALRNGETVICDRFTDATYAYQGGGRGIQQTIIQTLETIVQHGLKPDLTLLFDTDAGTGLARAGRRSKADRFETEAPEFFEKVRACYLEIAAAEPERVAVIDATPGIEQVQLQITGLLKSKGLC